MKNKKEIIIYLLLLLIIILGVYYKSLNSALIWDSRLQIEKNRLIVKTKSLIESFKFGFWEATGSRFGASDYYRPLTIASLILNKKIFGNSNISYKAVNLFLFYLILIIFYFYLKSQNGEKYFAEITTLIFAVFPLNIDNVVWVVGRCDLFMLLWGLSSLYLLDKFIRNNNRIYLIFSSFFFLIGLFSKESSVFFLPFFFFYELLKRKKITVWYHFLNTTAVGLLFFAKFSVNGAEGLKFQLFQPFIKNIYIFFGTMGYYFKSSILPFDFVMFTSLDNIIGINYFIWGFIFLIIIISLFYMTIKQDSSLRIPLLFIFNFLPFYLLFAYSNLYPYSISTRYIIIPYIGLLWIGVNYILKIKTKLKYYILFLIIISFSFSTLYNSLYYRTSELFWGKMYKKNPTVPIIDALYANSLFKKRDFVRGEAVLKKALKNKMRNYTAVFISAMFINLEYQKANYNKALSWIKTTKNLKVDNLNKIQIYKILSDINISKGNFFVAETIISKAITELKFTDFFHYKLLKLYIGYEKWDKAKQLIKKYPNIFKNRFNINLIKHDFDSYDIYHKFEFFIEYKNFKKALEIFKKIKTDSLKDRLTLAELFYRSGDEKQGGKIIKELYFKSKDNYKILNTLGFFYLKKLSRIDESLKYFKLSLMINPRQEKLIKLVNYYKNMIK